MRHRRVNGVDNLKRLRELAASKLKELAGLGESNGQAYEANDWDTPVVVPSKDSSDWDNKLAQLVSASVPAKPKRRGASITEIVGIGSTTVSLATVIATVLLNK